MITLASAQEPQPSSPPAMCLNTNVWAPAHCTSEQACRDTCTLGLSDHTGVHISITHLTSVFMHPTLPPFPTPNPTTNMHAGAPPFSAQHQGTENLTKAFHTPFPRKHTRVHTASQDSELGAVSAGWAPPLPSRQRGCRPQREQRPSGCSEGGAEPPASSSLAMLVCLGSTATASSGSDCRVNHSDDLNNYRLLKSEKKKKKTKQGNK